MFSIFQNKFNFENNINVKIEPQKHETEHKIIDDIVEISYDIHNELLFDIKNLPIINPQCINNNTYIEILEKISSTLDSLCNELWINRIIITNTGNKEIKLSDFYENDKLGFEISSSIIAAIVNTKTKKYINANITYQDKNLAYINFDTIEPNDSIVIDTFSLRKWDYITLHGKTKYFEAPKKYFEHDNEKVVLTEEPKQINKSYNLTSYIITLFLLCMLGLSAFSIYLEHNHKNLYIRNPFIIIEATNTKK